MTGVRDDPHARENPYEVEVEKEEHEKGTYIKPSLYDQPEERTPENKRMTPGIEDSGE